MELKKSKIEELGKIVEKDYGVFLNDEQLNELGVSLLRLAKIAIGIDLAREDEQVISSEKKGSR